MAESEKPAYGSRKRVLTWHLWKGHEKFPDPSLIMNVVIVYDN